MKLINKITLSIAIAASTTACFNNAQTPVENTQANQAPQVSADNTQPNQALEVPVNDFPQNQAPQALARNVQHTQAQIGFNPAGKWKCITTIDGKMSNGMKTALVHKSIIRSHQDGRFQAQVIVSEPLSTKRFSTQGNWNLNRTPQGIFVQFKSQYKHQLGVITPLVFGGFVRNRNILQSTINYRTINIQNGRTVMTCQRIQ